MNYYLCWCVFCISYSVLRKNVIGWFVIRHSSFVVYAPYRRYRSTTSFTAKRLSSGVP